MDGAFDVFIEDEQGHAVIFGQDQERSSGGGREDQILFCIADCSLSSFDCYYGLRTRNTYWEWGRTGDAMYHLHGGWKGDEFVVDIVQYAIYPQDSRNLDSRGFIDMVLSKYAGSETYVGSYTAVDSQFRPGSYTTVEGIAYVVQPIIPYDWPFLIDRKLPVTRNDWRAIQNCMRDTIAEETTLATNSYANWIQGLDAVRDVASLSFSKLFKEGRQYWNNLMTANGIGVPWYVTKESAERLKQQSRKILRDKTKKYLKGTAKAPADWWLKYRYAYTTTRMDIEQSIHRAADEHIGLQPDRVLRGACNISNGRAFIKMRLHDTSRATFTRLLIAADRGGFMPGLYNLWDMIPFSFVADWVFPIGDILQDWDQRIYFNYYEIDELLVTTNQSLRVKESWGDTRYRAYRRELLYSWPEWSYYTGSKTSQKTKTYRLNDSLALTVGMTVH
jgi:hypothetical protein